MKTARTYLLPSVFLMLAMIINGFSATAQDNQPLNIIFLKDSMQVEEGVFQFNNARVENRSRQQVNFLMELDATQQLNLLSPGSQVITLQPGESRLIPFRFTAKNIHDLSWQEISVKLTLSPGGYILQKSFFLQNRPTANWKVRLTQPAIYFDEHSIPSQVDLLVENTGNTTGNYSFRLESDINGIVPPTLPLVQIEAGRSAQVHLPVDTKALLALRSKSIEILVFIRAENGEQRMLRQVLLRMGSIFNGGSNAWYSMPLTLEAQVMNLGTSQPFFMAGVQGSVRLNETDQLNLNFRTNNFYDGYAANTYQATAQYRHGDLSLTAGTILDYNQFAMDGNGLRLNVDKSTSRWQLTAMNSRNNGQSVFEAKQELKEGKNFSWKGNSIMLLDREQNQDSYLHLSTVQWEPGRNTTLQFQGGYGAESIHHNKIDTIVSGFQLGYGFQTQSKHWMFNSNISIYPKNFPGLNKGSQYHHHELRYTSGAAFTGPYMEMNSRKVVQFRDTVLNEMLTMDNTEWGWRFGVQQKNFSVILSPGLLRQQQENAGTVHADFYKMTINMNWQFNTKWSLSLYSNGGKLFAGDRQPIFIHNHVLSIQSRRFGMHARLEDGPFYYYEVKNYLQGQQQDRRINVSPYADFRLEKLHIQYRAQLNYYSAPGMMQQDLFQAYHGLQYDAKRGGMSVSLNAQHDFTGNMTPMFHLSVRKQLNLPVIPNKKSGKGMIVLFLDKNNNRIKDQDEELVGGARVMIEGELVETNAKGELILKNIATNILTIDLTTVQQLKGWIPAAGYKQKLVMGKAGITYIAFSRSRMISGKINAIMDENSARSLTLDGIRITAIADNGETYQTLTRNDGYYTINLPAGNYLVQINTAALDSQFKVTEPSRQVDLENNEIMNVDFKVVQKRREMHVIRE